MGLTIQSLSYALSLAWTPHPNVAKWAPLMAQAVVERRPTATMDQQLRLGQLGMAIILRESGGDPNAKGGRDRGLMQINMDAHPHFFTLFTAQGTPFWMVPLENVRQGVAVLISYLDVFLGNEVLGVPSYNAGPGTIQQAIKGHPASEWQALADARTTPSAKSAPRGDYGEWIITEANLAEGRLALTPWNYGDASPDESVAPVPNA